MFGLNEKTVRSKAWKYAKAIRALMAAKITWPDNMHEWNSIFCFTLDTVHSPVMEPRLEPDARWRSPKFNGPGFSYELALAIDEDKCIWRNGPKMAGTSDYDIFAEAQGLREKIPAGKKGIADRGYRTELNKADVKLGIRNRLDTAEVKAFKRRVRARHENFNARIKNFAILSHKFRHGVRKHVIVFDAILVICQYEIESAHPLMGV